MNTEASTERMPFADDLVTRARRHAALADPARLRIVDTLSLGDASPSELQTMLGMSSNLLAHHLRTLDEAGLVGRRRSQGDRRRSYVFLRPGALSGLQPGTATASRGVGRLVFVCTANSARSQLAAALWAQVSEVPATSAGTHPAAGIAAGARAAASRRRIPLTQRSPQLLGDVRADGDYLVTVCDNAYEELLADHTVAPLGDLHWSVPDPVRVGTDDAFDTALSELEDRVIRLADRLHPLPPHEGHPA